MGKAARVRDRYQYRRPRDTSTSTMSESPNSENKEMGEYLFPSQQTVSDDKKKQVSCRVNVFTNPLKTFRGLNFVACREHRHHESHRGQGPIPHSWGGGGQTHPPTHWFLNLPARKSHPGFLKIAKPRPHPRSIKSQSLGVGLSPLRGLKLPR